MPNTERGAMHPECWSLRCEVYKLTADQDRAKEGQMSVLINSAICRTESDSQTWGALGRLSSYCNREDNHDEDDSQDE